MNDLEDTVSSMLVSQVPLNQFGAGAATSTPIPTGTSPPPAPPASSGSHTWRYVLVAFLVAVVAAVIIFYTMRQGKNTPDDPDAAPATAMAASTRNGAVALSDLL